MIDQPQRFLDRLGCGDVAILVAIDENHGQTKGAGRGDLGIGRLAAAVLGDDHIDLVSSQQRGFGFDGEGAAGEEILDRGRGQEWGDRVDAANEIVMLRGGIEVMGLLPTDREEDATGFRAKCCDGFLDRGDGRPAVAFDGVPANSFEPDQRRFGMIRRTFGIGGNLPGERMRRVDQQVYSIGCKVVGQSFRAAEAAGTDGNRLGCRIDRAAGERQGYVEIGARGKPARQFACVPRAAQYEDASLVHA